MNKIIKTVFIIDDDRSIRRSLSLFLIALDYAVETYASAEEFLEREPYNGVGCIILDINLEGKSGIDLQEELLLNNSQLPIIFITGKGSIKLSVYTLKKGAINFLEKPFKDEELLNSISEAILKSQLNNEEIIFSRQSKIFIDSLTHRESEVLKYLITGMLNKQIAAELNIAEHTIKLHRHSICEKLGVKSVPEIIRIADKAGIIPSKNKY
jgi:FixJ family two-component response regulator